MADGTGKNIKDIKVGDRVRATDPTTGKTTAQIVLAVHINHDTQLTDLTVKVNGETATIHTTAHHPIWDETRQVWVNAGDLQPDTVLRTATGEGGDLLAVTNYPGAQNMWNLTVADVHTFYVVAGDAAVLVHNCGGSIDGHSKYCDCANGGEPKLLPDFKRLPSRPNPDELAAQTRHPNQPTDPSEWAARPDEPEVPETRSGKIKWGLGKIAEILDELKNTQWF